MKDEELNKLLKKCTPLEPSDAEIDKTVGKAVLAFQANAKETQASPEKISEKKIFSLSAIAGFTALACSLCLVLFFLLKTSPPETGKPTTFELASLEKEKVIFSEIEALFQSNLSAVIFKEGSFDFKLSETGDINNREQLLVVEIRRGEDVLHIFTFSGQEVTADIGGKSISFEVLLTAENAPIVYGDEFILEDNQSFVSPEWTVNALSVGNRS